HTGNFEALLTVLDPEVVFRIDGAASPKGVSREVRGAPAVARQFSGRAQGARTALVDGAVAALVAPRGHLFLVLNFTISNDKIVEIEAVADPARLRQLQLAHPLVRNGSSVRNLNPLTCMLINLKALQRAKSINASLLPMIPLRN